MMQMPALQSPPLTQTFFNQSFSVSAEPVVEVQVAEPDVLPSEVTPNQHALEEDLDGRVQVRGCVRILMGGCASSAVFLDQCYLPRLSFLTHEVLKYNTVKY